MKKSKNYVESSGLLIVCEKKLLLIKPKGLEEGHYSIPKGMIENAESNKEAAIRETKEEIGIEIKENQLKKQFVVNYFNKGFLTKRVYCYLVIIDDRKIKDFNFILQKDEVDSASFYDLENAKNKIFWRFKEILNQIGV